MSPSDDTKLNVLHDHYKDSFKYIRDYILIRDRLLLCILAVLAILSVQIFAPNETKGVLNDIITDKIGTERAINASVIGTALWFGLLCLIVKYFQTVIHIERQYSYLHKLEERMSAILKEELYTREGKSYSEKYSKFSEWTHFLYTVLFPIVLICIAIIQIRNEWSTIKDLDLSVTLIINSMIFLFLVGFVLYYLYIRHEEFLKGCLKKMQNFLK